MIFLIFYITAILSTYDAFIVPHENNVEIYINIKQTDPAAIYFISDLTAEDCVKDSVNIDDKSSDLGKSYMQNFFKPLTSEEKRTLYDLLNLHSILNLKDKARADLFKSGECLLMAKIPYDKNKICIDRVTTLDLLTANTYSRSKDIVLHKEREFYKLEFCDSYDYNENYLYPLISSSYHENIAKFKFYNPTEILKDLYYNKENDINVSNKLIPKNNKRGRMQRRCRLFSKQFEEDEIFDWKNPKNNEQITTEKLDQNENKKKFLRSRDLSRQKLREETCEVSAKKECSNGGNNYNQSVDKEEKAQNNEEVIKEATNNRLKNKYRCI
ncbi:putative SP-containing protein [Vairimorpha necatrix]|uniref:SP-containing protein n=1 Tax=Vairimorpha necatrix TaxID=6039 RepID=A0AAX4J884_9MICR